VTRSANILIVDDEQDTSLYISELLKDAGFSPFVASDGFKAVAACKVRLPDLVLLDVQMPFMSGMDVYKRLRADNRTKDIPVIFMRGEQDRLPLEADEESVAKPLDARTLLNVVHNAIKVRSLTEEIRRKEGELDDLRENDSVPEFKTNKFVKEFLKAQINQSRRYQVPLSLIVLKLDRQPELLKVHGQPALTALMTQLSKLVAEECRSCDILGRLQPGEICAILPHTPLAGATGVAERIRAAVAGENFHIGKFTLNLTSSLGVCQYSGGEDNDGSVMISYARSAQARASESGGNVTMVAQ
jgi:two-component system cell cycle response regulator